MVAESFDEVNERALRIQLPCCRLEISIEDAIGCPPPSVKKPHAPSLTLGQPLLEKGRNKMTALTITGNERPDNWR